MPYNFSDFSQQRLTEARRILKGYNSFWNRLFNWRRTKATVVNTIVAEIDNGQITSVPELIQRLRGVHHTTNGAFANRIRMIINNLKNSFFTSRRQQILGFALLDSEEHVNIPTLLGHFPLLDEETRCNMFTQSPLPWLANEDYLIVLAMKTGKADVLGHVLDAFGQLSEQNRIRILNQIILPYNSSKYDPLRTSIFLMLLLGKSVTPEMVSQLLSAMKMLPPDRIRDMLKANLLVPHKEPTITKLNIPDAILRFAPAAIPGLLDVFGALSMPLICRHLKHKSQFSGKDMVTAIAVDYPAYLPKLCDLLEKLDNNTQGDLMRVVSSDGLDQLINYTQNEKPELYAKICRHSIAREQAFHQRLFTPARLSRPNMPDIEPDFIALGQSPDSSSF